MPYAEYLERKKPNKAANESNYVNIGLKSDANFSPYHFTFTTQCAANTRSTQNARRAPASYSLQL